ncbi:MAG: serine hydrolase domain-containing protein [Bryobacteraceae bacterium]
MDTTVALLAWASLFALSAQNALDPARVDSVVRAEMTQLSVPGAQVVVTQGDRVIYARAFGVTNVSTRKPMTLGHRLRVGSITKMMTGMTILTLAAQHKVDLDAPVSRYVSGLAPSIGRVTVRQALTHSGGLNATLVFSPRNDNRHEESMLAEIRSLSDSALFTQPGEVISYSNYGFMLSGAVATSVSGLPYADAVQRLLLEPVSMSHSGFRFPIDSSSGILADGHALTVARKPEVVTPVRTDAAWWPAGYMYATAGDLGRFAIAVLNGGTIGAKRVLSADAVALFHQSVVNEPIAADLGGAITRSARYGFGITHSKWRGVRLLTHAGRLDGYGATLTLAPDQKVSVAILSNRFDARLWNATADIIMQLTPVGAPVPPPVAIALTATERSEYSGHFVNSPFDETLAVRGDKLIWSAAVSPISESREGEVRKLSNGTFEVLDKAGVRIAAFIFLRGVGGRIKYLARSDLRTLARMP